VQTKVIFRLFAAALFFAAALHVSAQGTAFSYQGQLSDGGAPANTSYDMRFTVYTAPTNGFAISGSITNFAVPVSNGLFTVTLDFGPKIFNGTVNGSNDWLDIGIRAIGVTNFTSLSPRQAILPVPYAMFATSASNLLGSLQSTQLVGTIGSSLFTGNYSNVVVISNSADVFVGNGSLLTALNASSITLGTLSNARLMTNVALVDSNLVFSGNNVFTGTNTFNGPGTYNGANTFSNWNNSFTGSFFGNGLVGWVGVPGISQLADRDHGYLLTGASFTTVMLPASTNLFPGDIVRVSGAGVGGWQVLVNPGQTIMGNLASYRNNLILPGNAGNDWRHICCSSDGGRMFAGGNIANGVYYSSDFGHSWTPTTISGNGFAVACSGNGNMVYAGYTGGAAAIQGSANGGLNFVGLTSPPSLQWAAIACSSDGSKLFTAPVNGYLYVWSGSSITPVVGNLPWSAVTCTGDGTNIAAAVTGGNIAVSLSAGASWNYVTAPGTACKALAAGATGQKLVAAYNGGVATSTNFGTSWIASTTPAGNWTCVAASADCNQLVAGQSNGLLYASANFGASWTAVTSTNQNWSSVCMSADGTKYAGTVSSVGSYAGGIFYGSTSAQPNTTASTNVCGSFGSAIELQYIGNNKFIPVSSSGLLWAN